MNTRELAAKIADERKKNVAAFEKHLERARQVVSSWPEWKQSLLGSMKAPQDRTKIIRQDLADFDERMVRAFKQGADWALGDALEACHPAAEEARHRLAEGKLG